MSALGRKESHCADLNHRWADLYGKIRQGNAEIIKGYGAVSLFIQLAKTVL